MNKDDTLNEVRDETMYQEILWEEVDSGVASNIALSWVKENIMHNRKLEILNLFTSNNKNINDEAFSNELSLIKICDELNKKQKITKSGALKHIDYLASYKIIEGFYITTDKGREKMYKGTKFGRTVYLLSLLCKSNDRISKLWNG